MRIEKVHIQAFGPFADCTLTLAPCMTVVFGTNESGKSTWHAALYAALCGSRRGKGQPKAEDKDFEQRHRPWDGDSWVVGGVISLQDGRRIELRHDLGGKVDCRATELTFGRDVSDQIIWEGSPDGSRWLGLDRRAFLATACVSQAHILDVLQDANALQTHLQRAAATAGADATAAAAVSAFEAAIIIRRAAELEQRVHRARELHESLAGKSVPDLFGDDALAQSVAAKLQAWSEMPKLPTLTGPTATELRAELEALPAVPEGDLEPDQEVVEARDTYEGARQALEIHLSSQPAAPATRPTTVSPEALRELARELETPKPVVDAALEARREAAQWRVSRLASGSAAMLWALALVITGLTAAFLSYRFLGVAAIILALSLGAWSILRSSARMRALEELRAADGALGAQAHALDEFGRHRQAASDRANALQLPAEPARLRQLANEVEEQLAAQRALQQWEANHVSLREKRDQAEHRMRGALTARRGSSEGAVMAGFAAYLRECGERDKQARGAARRPDLERQMRAREAAEDGAAADHRRCEQAEAELREVASRCEVAGVNDAELATRLREWLDRRSAALMQREAHVHKLAQLESLLEGATLEELGAWSTELRRQADELSSQVAPELLAAIELDSDPDSKLRRLRDDTTDSARRANQAAGQVKILAERLPTVPEAEEEQALAETELARVGALDETINLTRHFVQKAQERVHKDIAPVLAGTLKKWLPRITGGRYQDAIVDPASLNVKVSGASRLWREASLLSHGTGEQVYLLLRMAMVEHLTKQGEVCPLILDDVTVQCDTPRTIAIMEMLQQLSRERQVIVFSQEDDVRTWARANFEEPQDGLEVLDAAQVPA